MSNRWKLIILIFISLFIGILLQILYGEKNIYEYLNASNFDDITTNLDSEKITVTDELYEYTTGSTNYSDETIYVDENFSSELPIVIIDTGNEIPEKNSIYDSTVGYYVSTDKDGYAYGSMQIIDTNGINLLSDDATYYSDVKLRIRGNSSSNYDKNQYLIKLLDENGNSNSLNLLNMGSASNWVLSVSFIDKSLLRNYIAYETASLFMDYTPDANYCEVIYKTEEGYSYLGVSMLIEYVEQGENRVDIPDYSNNGKNVTYLMRRDRYDPDGLILENYATEENLLSGYIEVLYPNEEDISDADIEILNSKIDNFEKTIFSDDYETFIQYRELIDVESFVDYFLVNEFFLNYDAGFNSTYFYADYSGVITMGPVWDFDQAMDNNEYLDADLYTTAFHDAPWFRQLLRDPWFVEQIINRYKELREYELSDDHILTLINTTTYYLGAAIDRDWSRWGYYYTSGLYMKYDYVDRNTYTYDEEIEKIKYVIINHANWMDDNLDSLYQFSEFDYVSTESENYEFYWKELLALTFITGWVCVVVILQRRMN